MRLRMRLNNNAIVKGAGLVSNTIILAANAYLLGSGIRNSVNVKRQERVSSSLQTTAEIASAFAGLTKVIADTVGIYHVQDD